MNLDNFQSKIESRIIERGYQYYQDGCVRSLEETDPCLYQAKVKGSDLYVVHVELDEQNNILASECDCPYDLGETCKHEAAVYFALRERKTKAAARQVIPLQAARPRKGKNGIKKMLEDAPQEALVNFLLTLAGESEEMKTRLELAFGGGTDQEEIKRCRKLIRSYIDKNSDRHGFIGYHQMGEALTGIEMVLEKSRDALLKGKALQAVRLALMVIGEAVDMIQYGDDSDGGIGEVVGEGLFLLDEVSDRDDLPVTTQEGIFALILEEAENRRYNGWSDWQIDLLQRCAAFAATPAARERLEHFLQNLFATNQKNTWTSEYLSESILLIQYELLARFEGEEQASAFLSKNLNYSRFREMAIRQAQEQGDEEKIIRLCLEGEKKDKAYPGLLDRWQECRYQSYIRTGQLASQRSLALDFIEGGSFRHYQELKNTYSPEEWSGVYPDIIERLAKKKNDFRGIYTQVLVEEQEWAKLMQYVRENPFNVDSYYKHLVAGYREEVYRIFRYNIEQAAARANSRSHYQGVCAIIRTLKKAGGKKEAREAVQSLLLKYPKRPAFRDELSKIKLD